jgi:ketosteroid isomerase-like protein
MSEMRGNGTEQLKQLVDKWVTALLKGDANALSQMTADTFITIGPRGFLLGKEQWLEGFRTGDLRYESLTWDETSMWMYDEAAIVTGRDKQTVKYQGQPVETELRAQLVFVKQQGRWQLASQQYSPIAGPPNPPSR